MNKRDPIIPLPPPIRCRIRRMRVDGSRIRKEKVANSEIIGYW